jgi:type IV secretory pathway TrbL component
MVQEIIKYATYITALLAVLMIVYAGIMYSMQGISDAQKGESKKLIMKVIYGTIFLFLIGTILKFIAPWIYK